MEREFQRQGARAAEGPAPLGDRAVDGGGRCEGEGCSGDVVKVGQIWRGEVMDDLEVDSRSLDSTQLLTELLMDGGGGMV